MNEKTEYWCVMKSAVEGTNPARSRVSVDGDTIYIEAIYDYSFDKYNLEELLLAAKSIGYECAYWEIATSDNDCFEVNISFRRGEEK